MLFGSSTITQLITLVVVIPLLSRWYSPEQHGDITTFMSILAVGASIVTLKYDQAIMVEHDREKAKTILKLATLINLGFLILSSCLLVLFRQPIAQLLDFQQPPFWIYLIPPTIFLTGMVEVLMVWWNREKHYKNLSSNRILTFGVSAGYKLIHGWFKYSKINGLVLGHALGQFFSVLFFLPRSVFTNLTFNGSEAKSLFKQYKSFPTWAMPSGLINTFGSHIPVFLIVFFFDRETNGQYGNAMKLTYLPLVAVSHAISQVLFERLARIKNNTDEAIKLSYNILYFLFFLALVPVLAMLIWGDIITPFILGDNWETAGIMTQIMILYCFAMYISSPFSVAFEVYNRLRLQFSYTALFTLLTGIGLFVALKITHDIYIGLVVFALIGIIVRLAMLISCFRLIGQNPMFKILIGVFIIAVSLAAGAGIRYWLF